MIGILLIATAEIFAEISTSLGKYEVSKKKETLYAMGFLNAVWAALFLLILGLTRGEFIFSMASLPIFLTRAVIEVILLFVTLNAILSADRTTFSFLRILTIPLLLVVDLTLGYDITLLQMAGICIVVIALISLSFNHGLGGKGKILSLVSAILAVASITLYKYNITHYNSVEAEQTFMHLIILITLVLAAKIRTKENVFRYLTHRTFILQSLSSGIASVLLSFAYLFAPATIITASKRSFEVLASIVSGHRYFHEKHLILKLLALLFIGAGVILTVL